MSPGLVRLLLSYHGHSLRRLPPGLREEHYVGGYMYGDFVLFDEAGKLEKGERVYVRAARSISGCSRDI
jgi:hypothetical protein